MKKLYILFFAIFIISARFLFAQQEPPAGLKFLTTEEYEKLPKVELKFKGEIKRYVDLSVDMPPPGDQGKTASCVAWAVAYCLKSYHENLWKKESFVFYDGSLNYDIIFSPSFVYNLTNGCGNNPTFYPDALEVLRTIGAVTWTDLPFHEYDTCLTIDKSLLEKAGKYKINDWKTARFIDIQLFRETLSMDIPIMVAVAIDYDFYEKGLNYSQTTPYTWSAYKYYFTVGHAMVIVGYDEDKKAFKLINSYGKNWGTDGFVWIPYRFARECITEAYIIIN
jgi:hypothetical protein